MSSVVTRVYCGQTVGRIKVKLGMQVGLGPGHIVLDGNPAPPPPKGHSPPQFSAHICCSQMAPWIKMSLGMEQGLGLEGLCVRCGPRSPLSKGGQSTQIFGPCLLWPNGCVISANLGSFRAHCVKVHVRYLISW